DVEYARSKGIEVKNVAGYSTESVAQLTLGVALSLANKIAYYDRYVKSGDYSRSDMFTHYGPPFYELKGKTLGIIGLGNIGKRVAQLFEAFGMKIVYHSFSGKNVTSQYPHLDLNELLSVSDIVSIHCPLTPQTQNLIHSGNINKMKPGAIVVNMARGGIVNEKDIIEALNKGIIGGFATDVFEKEPMSKDSPFFNLTHPERLILTPHIAWTSVEARTLLIDKLTGNIRSFLDKD
ncbi:MAG TPA: NAD(P)-dependent oxidoreductase, partial [Bacteroidales bacterium]|nr:NAD(P)-dependent oxidoreductase [Bacteroidales bacterium]